MELLDKLYHLLEDIKLSVEYQKDTDIEVEEVVKRLFHELNKLSTVVQRLKRKGLQFVRKIKLETERKDNR